MQAKCCSSRYILWEAMMKDEHLKDEEIDGLLRGNERVRNRLILHHLAVCPECYDPSDLPGKEGVKMPAEHPFDAAVEPLDLPLARERATRRPDTLEGSSPQRLAT
jgi:hypothetical protein